MARDAVMACYAVGKSTGVVVDISGSRTTVTPVHEGWVEGENERHKEERCDDSEKRSDGLNNAFPSSYCNTTITVVIRFLK